MNEMKLIVLLALVGFLAWKFSPQLQTWVDTQLPGIQSSAVSTVSAVMPEAAPANVRCDGRQHCSQMTSCAEATQFLRHCPGMKMDGDGDGVPCETQWCR